MSEMYELFDTESGNVIGAYDSEREALEILKSAIEAYGPSYADALVLGVRDRAGRPKAIAQGRALAQLALSQVLTG